MLHAGTTCGFLRMYVHLHGMRAWRAWMSMRVGLASRGSCARWFGTPPAIRPPTSCMLVRSMACHVFVSYSVVTFTAWCTGVKHVCSVAPVTFETIGTCCTHIVSIYKSFTSSRFIEISADAAVAKLVQYTKSWYTCCVSDRQSSRGGT